jgi:hypothetical protein
MQGGQSCCFPQLTAVLAFSCSCLVSFSHSEVRQFSLNAVLWFKTSSLWSTAFPALGGVLSLCFFTDRTLCAESLVLCSTSSLLGRFRIPSTPSSVYVWLQFSVCFSVLWGSSVSNAALLLKSALWSTMCPALGGGLSPHPTVFATFPVFAHWEFRTENLVLCPVPFLWGRFSILLTPSAVCVWVQFTVCLSVLLGRISLPRGCSGLCSCVVHDVHLFLLPIDTQAGLELEVAGRNGANFSKCSTARGYFPWARCSGWCRVWFLLMLFLLDEGRREGGKKRSEKPPCGRTFSRARPALLAMP